MSRAQVIQSAVNQFAQNDFLCACTNVVHPRDPSHLIGRLECFGYALTPGQLIHNQFNAFIATVVDLGEMSDLENDILIQTPSSALGSCRYKLKKDNPLDFEKMFAILDKYDIETMFYIGGNDSMDTVASLDQYAREHAIRRSIMI